MYLKCRPIMYVCMYMDGCVTVGTKIGRYVGMQVHVCLCGFCDCDFGRRCHLHNTVLGELTGYNVNILLDGRGAGGGECGAEQDPCCPLVAGNETTTPLFALCGSIAGWPWLQQLSNNRG